MLDFQKLALQVFAVVIFCSVCMTVNHIRKERKKNKDDK